MPSQVTGPRRPGRVAPSQQHGGRGADRMTATPLPPPYAESPWSAPGRSLRSLFVVGAPRCGTTSLSKALRHHPQICVSKPKETFFFVREGAPMEIEQRASEFIRRYYPHLEPGQDLIVEATPVYLYAPEAVERILEIDPDAKLVVMVRNPVDLVHSHHGRMLYTMDEDVKDFATAWRLREARSRGDSLPKRCRHPRVVDYGFVGSLGARVEELFARAGRERCHVIVYDDLRDRGPETLRELLRFAGVDLEVELKLKRARSNNAYKREWLQPYVTNPPKPIFKLLELWERKGKGRTGYLRPLRKRFKKWNTKPVERDVLDPALRAEVADAFAADVEKLSKLLDRDLSHWR